MAQIIVGIVISAIGLGILGSRAVADYVVRGFSESILVRDVFGMRAALVAVHGIAWVTELGGAVMAVLGVMSFYR